MILKSALAMLALSLLPNLVLAKTHVLKKGETLATLAREYYGEPVWGPKGTIKKIYKLNPWALSNPNLVEPGQAVVIDDESASAVPAPIVNKEAVILPPIEPMPPMHRIEPVVATEISTNPTPTPTPEPAPAVEKIAEAVVAPTPAPVPTAPATAPTSTGSTKPKSYFIVAPTFTSSKITNVSDPNGFSFDLNSNSNYGVRLAWDHWWTKSFSSILTYNLSQLKSTATNDTSTESFANSINTTSTELALLNRLGSFARIGFGATYGTHLFVEGFATTPADQSVYNVLFWNPFFMTELNLLSTERFDLFLTLKAAPMPADVGHEHDLKSGMEYSGKLSVMQKLGDSAFSLGVTYLQNDQGRIATQQSRKDTIFEIGFLF